MGPEVKYGWASDWCASRRLDGSNWRRCSIRLIASVSFSSLRSMKLTISWGFRHNGVEWLLSMLAERSLKLNLWLKIVSSAVVIRRDGLTEFILIWAMVASLGVPTIFIICTN
jgi:hypothetical protein